MTSTSSIVSTEPPANRVHARDKPARDRAFSAADGPAHLPVVSADQLARVRAQNIGHSGVYVN